MTQQHPDGPPPEDPRSYGDPAPVTPPALRQPRWSGKKTAVVAALAIGLSSAGAITASAAVPSGSAGGDRIGGRGGFGNFRSLEGGGQNIQPGTTGNSGGTNDNSGPAGGAAGQGGPPAGTGQGMPGSGAPNP